MWESNFGAVNGAVAGSLDDGEDVMVFWVENNALSSRLHDIRQSDLRQRCWDRGRGGGGGVGLRRTLRLSTAADMMPRQFGRVVARGRATDKSVRGTGCGRFTVSPHWNGCRRYEGGSAATIDAKNSRRRCFA